MFLNIECEMSEKNIPTPSLYNFFIFNPSLCKKEGQENEKILFYHCNEVITCLI